MSDLSDKAAENTADEPPASVPQTSLLSEHPHLSRMKEEIAAEIKRQGGGDGGGTMSDLERRVGHLETDVRTISNNLHALVADTAAIKSNYASKADIANLKTELKTDIADLKLELKTDIASIKNEIASANLNQTRWMIGTLLAAISLVFAIQRFSPPAPHCH